MLGEGLGKDLSCIHTSNSQAQRNGLSFNVARRPSLIGEPTTLALDSDLQRVRVEPLKSVRDMSRCRD